MTRAQRIKRIAQLAETDKQVATQTLSASRRARDENARRLEEFQSYRHEYLQALREGGATLSAARVREIRRFIDQLELTINALRRDLDRCETRCVEDLAKWAGESRRSRALADVATRSARDDLRAKEGRAQHELDDRAARVACTNVENGD